MSSLDSLLRPILIPPTQSLWSALIRVYIDRIESLWGGEEEIKIAALDIPAGSHPNTRGWGGGCRLVHRRAHLHVGLSIAFRRLIGQLNQLLISTWSCERAFCQPFLLLPSSVILFRNMAETRADLRCKKTNKKTSFHLCALWPGRRSLFLRGRAACLGLRDWPACLSAQPCRALLLLLFRSAAVAGEHTERDTRTAVKRVWRLFPNGSRRTGRHNNKRMRREKKSRTARHFSRCRPATLSHREWRERGPTGVYTHTHAHTQERGSWSRSLG